jgi:hypothetical protein
MASNQPTQEKTGDTVLDFFSTVTEWLWVGIATVVGFMFKKLFNHDTQLGEHNTQIALLESQGERFEEFCINDIGRREKAREETVTHINQQHEAIMTALSALKEK